MSGPNLLLMVSRIPPKFMLCLVTLLAVGAGVMVQSSMHKSDEELARIKESLNRKVEGQMLVAARDIPEGETISADALTVKNVDVNKIPAGALTSQGEALGLQARTSIHAGDSLMSQFLRFPEKAQGFEAKIKPGYRAITFPVDTSSGVAGFLTPDCRVDILAQMGGGAESKTLPILSDVHVVAVGTTYKKVPGQTEAQPTSSVTVEVQPTDGGKLINAMAAGKLYCLMRNQSDHAPITVRDISSTMAKRTTQGSPSELSVLPTSSSLPERLPELPPAGQATVLDRQHSIQMWNANHKDELAVPKE